MTTRIDAKFAALARERRAALVTFVMAGDPDYETSLAILKALPKAGADMIEIGMPFTDPMADGPAIQAAGLRALKAGQTLKKTLALVAAFRAADAHTPIVLMGYYNPIYVYGVERFLVDATTAGVDGLIVVDLPPEEDEELCLPALKAGLNFIRLATPTTDDARLPAVLANTSGFVYYVSITGITGSAAPQADVVGAAVARIKQHTHLPVAVGFGVRDAHSAASMAQCADGVVVGSALVEALRLSLVEGCAGPRTVEAVVALTAALAAGVHGVAKAGNGESVPMNWMSNVVPPKIRSLLRRDTPENLWVKCPESGQLVFHKDLEANLMVVPGSGYHMAISPRARLAALYDGGEYDTLTTPESPVDPLKFRDIKRYADRLKEHRAKTGSMDAILASVGRIEDQEVVTAVHDFAFQGGTLGMAAGEAIVTAMGEAVSRAAPFVIFTASGGARMQEGMFSLMQMARTTVAVQRMRAARVPYIVVLTNPTTGGVTASYAMLGDVQIAEPGAVIGFAGARVIEQTVRQRLPEGFQRAEFLKEHGMVDLVTPRTQMRAVLSRLCKLLAKKPAAAAA